MTSPTLATILTDVGAVVTFLMGLFSDLIEAVTSNIWLLLPILLGLTGSALALVWRQIRKGRRLG